MFYIVSFYFLFFLCYYVFSVKLIFLAMNLFLSFTATVCIFLISSFLSLWSATAIAIPRDVEGLFWAISYIGCANLVCSEIFQANEILFAFHRVLSVQLTMLPVHTDESLSDDDDVYNYVVPATLPCNSLEGAAVAVHWVLYTLVRFTYLSLFGLFIFVVIFCLSYVFVAVHMRDLVIGGMSLCICLSVC